MPEKSQKVLIVGLSGDGVQIEHSPRMYYIIGRFPPCVFLMIAYGFGDANATPCIIISDQMFLLHVC